MPATNFMDIVISSLDKLQCGQKSSVITMQELSLSTITRNFGCLIYVRCFRNKMSGIFFKTTNYCLCVAGISEGKERFC